MAEIVKFGKAFNEPRQNQKGTILFPPRNNQSITVRFVGVQQRLYSTWDSSARAFNFYESKREKAVQRIVSFVVDRSDEKVKAFLCPVTVFNKMGEYDITHDFSINRYGQGLNTKYEVESLGESSVSEEIENKVAITSETYSLVDIFVNKVKWSLLDVKIEPITDRFDILDL